MNENGPEYSGFTQEDEEFLNSLDQVLNDRKKGEDSFWALWHTMDPKHRGIYIEHCRARISEDPKNEDPDIGFFRRIIKQWDDGELE